MPVEKILQAHTRHFHRDPPADGQNGRGGRQCIFPFHQQLHAAGVAVDGDLPGRYIQVRIDGRIA